MDDTADIRIIRGTFFRKAAEINVDQIMFIQM